MKKEQMEEPKNFVESKDVRTYETESISPIGVKDELSNVEHVQVGQSAKIPNDNTNPSFENPTTTKEKG
jgi:hypothetical protein